MEPTYDKSLVQNLAAGEETFGMSQGASDDALGFGLDGEIVRNVLQRIHEFTFLKTEPTRKGHDGTDSDYYTYYVEECLTQMFIKFLVDDGVLIVTSFKEDNTREY